MRARKWVIILSIIFAVFIIAAWGLRFIGVQRVVNNLMLLQLRPVLGENATLESVDIQLGCIVLNNLHYADASHGIAVDIGSVRFNLKLINIIIYGLSPLNLVDEIQLENWSVSITEGVDEDSTELTLSESGRTPWKLPSELVSVKKINITEGTIRYNEFSLERFYGWFDLGDPDSIQYNFSASLCGDTVNLWLKGEIFTRDERISADLTLNEISIPSPFKPLTELEIQEGKVKAAVQADLNENRISLYGEVLFDSLNVVYEDTLNFRSGVVRVGLNGDTLDVDGSGFVFDTPISFNGEAVGFSKPWFDLTLASEQLDLKKLFGRVKPPIKAEGMVSLQLKVRGELSSPELSFSAASRHLVIDEAVLENVSAEGEFSEGEIRLNTAECHAFGGAFNGGGTLSLADNGLILDINAHYRGKPSLEDIFPQAGKISVDSLEFTAEIRGDAANPSINGLYSVYPTDIVNFLSGKLEYQDRQVHIVEASGCDDSLQLEVDWSGETPRFSATGINLHRLLAVQEKLHPVFSDSSFSLLMEAAGSFNDFILTIDAITNGAELSLGAKVEMNEVVKFIGDYAFTLEDTLESKGDIAFRIKNDTLILDNFTVSDDFYAWGELDLKERRIIKFQGKGEEFALDTLLLFLGMEDWRSFRGDLKFDISLAGDVSAPDAEFSGYLTQGNFHGIGGYWSSIAAELKKGMIRLVGLDFGNMEQVLLSGRGYLDLESGELDFRASLDDVNPDLLVNGFTGKKGVVTGKAGYTIQAVGTLEDPRVEVGIRVEDGSVFKIPFDQFAGGVILEKGSGSLLGADIPELRLIKNGSYDIGLKGYMPLTGGEMDIELKAEGRLLSILPNLTGQFTAGDGMSKVEVQVGGTLNSPRVNEAAASLRNGVLEMKSVVDRIDRLNLETALEGDFIHIADLSGEINGVPFVITTIPEVYTVDGLLEPWVMGSTGLSLGIITLETGREGLKIEMPNFVEPGETANLSAVGKYPEEVAYIAGPEKHPVVRAKLIVRDGVLSYPPPMKKTKGKKSVITKLLEKIDWDLELIPDRGNTYIRDMSGIASGLILKDISGLFSRVMVDLDVERRVEGLKLDGVLNDDTFNMSGRLVSSRGTVNLLDMDFQVQEFIVEFDPSEKVPLVEGYATTTVRDSLGRDIIITLRVAHVDPVTSEKTYVCRWGDFTFVFEDDLGNSQEQILGLMGYTPETIGDRMTGVPLKAVDQAFFGAWLTKLEREIKNVLGMDYVNIDPAVAQNLLEERLLTSAEMDTADIDWRAKYLRRTRFTIGKYLTDDLFFIYTGRFGSGESPFDHRRRLGMIHSWNLEYRLPAKGANLLMVVGYEYDNLENKTDRRVSIKYTFNF
ncbi:MAG: translocation/assembly module TamB domain-containing protein [candidate division Zixibacteria bacterium]|nr:translocation/assembly module TamB domain-containing protein [Candidatus Tariuqbacter arcticus]